jgi:D-glycero-alpha-D-manno-heptose 1-phosphate guanylyltransferase
MNADILKKHIKEEKFSIEKDFFEKKLDEIKIYGLASEAYFLDIGVPEDYKKAQDDFKTL